MAQRQIFEIQAARTPRALQDLQGFLERGLGVPQALGDLIEAVDGAG